VHAVIIESIVTTQNAAGIVNIAPMGVDWPDDPAVLILKPFIDTTTFRNLRETGAAVINLTDDVRVFTQAALSLPMAEPTIPATVVDGVVLANACSWREVEMVSVDATPPRARIDARVVHHGRHREFLGFNRARHAVLEATILATRLHLIPHDEVRAEVARLQILIDKTAGPREREAWTMVTTFISTR
jgi:hypothetical protein